MAEGRDRVVSAVETCTSCHDGLVAESYAYSFHGTALRLGETSIATCVDCHGKHSVETFASVTDVGGVADGSQLLKSCGQQGCHHTSVTQFPEDYREHVVPQKSDIAPIRGAWKFFIVLILFDTVKDGPIVIFELIRTLRNDMEARVSRRKKGGSRRDA